MSENVEARKQHYKNLSKGSDELRSRRHAVTVNLRKSKKEDQMNKRRNIDEEDVKSPLKEINGTSPTPNMTLKEIWEGMQSSNGDKIFMATQAARKMLSRERNPPITIMVEKGLVPMCTAFLDNYDMPSLQFEAAWALTNVASGTSEHTMAVVNAGAVPKLINLLSSPSSIVAEQAVWALGNISGDGATSRDIVLNNNVIYGLINLINEKTPV